MVDSMINSDTFYSHDADFSRHQAAVIGQNINRYLEKKANEAVIFSGFACVASTLGDQHDITYVDGSDVSGPASGEHPDNIRRIVHKDVLDYIFFNASPYLVISCRTSSNWLHSFQLDKLVKALERNRYKRVVIDFFDAERFSGVKGSEEKDCRGYLNCTEGALRNLSSETGHSVANATRVISGESGTSEIKARLAVYDKETLVSYLSKSLRGYIVKAHSSLIPSDPSFTVTFSPRHTLNS